jgi:hypothetical protein
MNLKDLNDHVKQAEENLLYFRKRLARGEYLRDLLNRAGLSDLPEPQRMVYDARHTEGLRVTFRWPLWATSEHGGCANGCGFICVNYGEDHVIEWSWEAYSGKNTPAFVKTTAYTRMTGHSAPAEFVEFAKKYAELLYDPHEQVKRNVPGVLVRR